MKHPELVLLVLAAVYGCRTDWDCSLNGVCTEAVCACDSPWAGTDCGNLTFAPGNATTGPELGGKALACYHGDDNMSYSWGASVQYAQEDDGWWMWVAVMTNHCTIGQWRTNSEVQLARSRWGPLGPFEKVADVVLPWAHNPQTIVSPDPGAQHGYVYALFTLGNGVPVSGEPVNCNKTQPPHVSAPAAVVDKPRLSRSTNTVYFTIHWAEEARGPYEQYNASILDWPSGWDYGEHGNWNPSPWQHPNGTVYLMAHTSWKAFCGEAILRADSWRGPYRVVASDTYSSWGGSACGVEDPFLWTDKRGHWHVLYHSLSSISAQIPCSCIVKQSFLTLTYPPQSLGNGT